jgi:hypothetical protein
MSTVKQVKNIQVRVGDDHGLYTDFTDFRDERELTGGQALRALLNGFNEVESVEVNVAPPPAKPLDVGTSFAEREERFGVPVEAQLEVASLMLDSIFEVKGERGRDRILETVFEIMHKNRRAKELDERVGISSSLLEELTGASGRIVRATVGEIKPMIDAHHKVVGIENVGSHNRRVAKSLEL